LDDEELIFQKDRFFFKFYKKFYNEYIYDLSPHTVKVLLFLIDNLHHKDNSVVINGKFPSQDEMVEKSGVAIKSFKKAISELVDKNIIVSERHRHIRKIYLNPRIIEDDKTEKLVHRKFK
jgi:DNA-binding MarR family transcriptional regulator